MYIMPLFKDVYLGTSFFPTDNNLDLGALDSPLKNAIIKISK